MKKVRKQQKGIPFLLALLLIFSIFVPISFADSQNTMKEFKKMEGLPVDKVFSVRFNDVLDLENILQKQGIRIVDANNNPQNITLALDPSDEKILKVHPPESGYTPGGEYILYIHDNWIGKFGKKLRQGIQMKFSILETPSPTDDFIFDKNTGTITGYKGSAVQLVIPEQIDGITVQYIGKRAFENCLFTAVTIPDSVIAIHNHAFFNCEILSSLTLGNQLTSIGESAFSQCQINTLTLPPSLRNIHRYAFVNNKMNTLNFATNGKLETIDYQAFASNNLSSLTIPNSVRTIGYSAFAGNAIPSLVIPDSVHNIDSRAFSHNPLATVELPKHTVTGDNAFPSTTKVTRRP